MDGSYRWVIAGDKHAPLLVAYENERRLLTAPLPGSVVDLRLRVENQQIRFDYAGPDGVWHSAGSAAAPLLARCPLGRFTGAFAGVYASSNGQPTTNQAVFDYFEYRNEPSR
jgi:alpha-N-arabinofuranosidase